LQSTFAFHKYSGKSVLRYELGMDIWGGGTLMCIQGPYPTSMYTYIATLNKVMRHHLDPYERVEANDGERKLATRTKIICPKNVENL
jgi:hypothetical protein